MMDPKFGHVTSSKIVLLLKHIFYTFEIIFSFGISTSNNMFFNVKHISKVLQVSKNWETGGSGRHVYFF